MLLVSRFVDIMVSPVGVGHGCRHSSLQWVAVLLADKSDGNSSPGCARNTFRPITAQTIGKPRALRAEILKVRRQGYAFVVARAGVGTVLDRGANRFRDR